MPTQFLNAQLNSIHTCCCCCRCCSRGRHFFSFLARIIAVVLTTFSFFVHMAAGSRGRGGGIRALPLTIAVSGSGCSHVSFIHAIAAVVNTAEWWQVAGFNRQCPRSRRHGIFFLFCQVLADFRFTSFAVSLLLGASFVMEGDWSVTEKL